MGCHVLLQGIFLTQGSCGSCFAGRFFAAEPAGNPGELVTPKTTFAVSCEDESLAGIILRDSGQGNLRVNIDHSFQGNWYNKSTDVELQLIEKRVKEIYF